jgi:RNA polymerase sigma-70 factor (ECF subfamily)
MSTAGTASAAIEGLAAGRRRGDPPGPPDGLSAFEQIYLANFNVITAYFARRCADAQTVADLTSETFLRAAAGYKGFNPARGSARAWLFGIAAHVFAQHCAESAGSRRLQTRLAGRRAIPEEELEDITARIDAERAGAELLARFTSLPERERSAIELVDLDGLTPKEAAAVLQVPRTVLRKRLSRARSRLRKEHAGDE